MQRKGSPFIRFHSGTDEVMDLFDNDTNTDDTEDLSKDSDMASEKMKTKYYIQ